MNRAEDIPGTSNSTRVGAAVISCLVVCHWAGATTLITNTDQPVLGVVPNVFASQWVAAPFATGATPAQLNSVSLYEWTFDPPSGSFFVSVYGDNNGMPGAPIAGGALVGPAHPQGAAFQTYAASSPLSLSAHSRYWVVARSDEPRLNTYGWATATTVSYSSPVGWSYFDEWANSVDSGATWHAQGGIGNGFGPQLMAIDGAIVPEPAYLVVFGFPWMLSRRSRMS